MHDDIDYKIEAQKTWGKNPTGSIAAKEYEPGTKDFFETAVASRKLEEFPYLEKWFFKSFKGKKVLEVGAGPGYDAHEIIKNGADYTGIDLTPENIIRFKKHMKLMNLDNFIIEEGDAEKLPFDDSSFDIYFSNGVLHHVPNFKQSLIEAKRVLNKGGKLIITLYNKNSVFYRFFLEFYKYNKFYKKQKTMDEILSEIEYTHADSTPLVRVFTKKEIYILLKELGFKNIKIRKTKLTIHDFPIIPNFRVAYPLNYLLPKLPRNVYYYFGKFLGWYLVCEATK